MGYVFVSHVEEDSAIAEQIADGLAASGYETWCYERNSLPGASYVTQIVTAIEQSNVVVIIISPDALGSWQVDKEVVEAHEHGRPFVPLLRGISHAEFRGRRPDWAMMIGAATSIPVPSTGVLTILPRVVAGMRLMGILPTVTETGAEGTGPSAIIKAVEKSGPSEKVSHEKSGPSEKVSHDRAPEAKQSDDEQAGQTPDSAATAGLAIEQRHKDTGSSVEEPPTAPTTTEERDASTDDAVQRRPGRATLPHVHVPAERLLAPMAAAVILALGIILVVRQFSGGGPVALATPTDGATTNVTTSFASSAVSAASSAAGVQTSAAATTSAPAEEGTWIVLARVPTPRAIALDRDGNLYVVDSGDGRIIKLSAMGQVVAQWGTTGTGPRQFKEPSGIAVDRDGNLYVADTGNARVQKLSPTGQPLAAWGTRGQGQRQFEAPVAIALDADGNIYVVDTDGRIQKLSAAGQWLTTWGAVGSTEPFKLPSSVVVDRDGNLYVADTGNSRIQKLSAMGQPLVAWGTSGTERRQFRGPSGVALDGTGNVYVADTLNARIQKLSATGQFLAVWGTAGAEPGQFDGPYGVALDSQDNLYVADYNNGRIQKLSGP